MTADEYRDALDRLGLSQVGAADVFGVGRRTAQRFAEEGPSPPVQRIIKFLLSLSEAKRAEWIGIFREMGRD